MLQWWNCNKKSFNPYFFLNKNIKTNQTLATQLIRKDYVSESSHFDGLVTIRAVVNDGERLLETGSPDADDISNQLTHSYDHLDESRNKTGFMRQRCHRDVVNIRGLTANRPIPAGVFEQKTGVPYSQSCSS